MLDTVGSHYSVARTPLHAPTTTGAMEQMRQAELAVARPMRERNLEYFTELVSMDAVFLGGTQIWPGV
jgi:hypothetical protein